MARPITITTAGLKELQGRMRRLEVALEPKDLTPILVNALELIRKKALENYEALGLHEITGNLLKALNLATHPSKSARLASAWVKAGSTARGSSARHAHLIERGHRIIGHKPNKTDLGKRVMARPFFRPAVDEMRSGVRRVIEEGIIKLLWDSEK